MTTLLDSAATPFDLDRLCEGVRDLYATARHSLPVVGVGLLQRIGSDHVALTHADAVGTSGHRCAAVNVSQRCFPQTDVNRLSEAELRATESGMLEARLLMIGMPDEVQRREASRQAVFLPLTYPDTSASLVVGLSDPHPPTDATLGALRMIATRAATLLDRRETADAELSRLRRLAGLEDVMGALIPVLDVREIFERVSDLSRNALPHEFLSVATFSEDRAQLQLYAQTSGWEFPDSGRVQFAPVLVDTFTYHLVDDILEFPLDPALGGKTFGVRSSLRVPVRLNDRTVAALNFSSRETARYGAADIGIARRIADYVALAMSHQRLADESRRASALQERAANLEMLDGLLNTLTGVLDVREVFDRISEIARKVLPHDMMALPLDAGNGRVLVYAMAGGVPLPSPQLIPLLDAHRALFKGPWEHIIYDDIQTDEFERETPPGKAGHRSILRVAIRLEGHLAGVLDFASFTPGFYTHADAVIGRRIADHIALVLSHQRLAEESLKAASLEARAGNLKMLDNLLSAITGVLDIREVFERVSQIASKVIPHDAMGLPIFTDDREHVIPYATTFPDGTLPRIQPLPESQRFLLTEPWDFHIVEDLQTHPDGRDSPFARIGMHALLRVPIRLEGELVGMLGFFSKHVGQYTQDDAILAKRIASHVALVISHQRLADESRQRAALQERQANLEMLDGLLRTLTGVLDIRQVFDRVSEIAQRVLPHDAVSIGEFMPDGDRVRMHAGQGIGHGPAPFETPVRDRTILTDAWDYRLMDDISEHPLYASSASAVRGMRSVLFVPIRLEEGRLYGVLTFYSKTPGHFTRNDVLIATRIADHIALALSHQRLADESQRRAALQERAASLDALDGLLSTVAGVLDVRDVFDRISTIGNTVMPHDASTIVVRTHVPNIVRLYAATGALRHLPVPLDVPIPNPRLLEDPWEFELIDNIQEDPRYASAPSAKAGMRSLLTMPIRGGGELLGGVNFLSSTAGRFTRDDVPMARRIADHIALALQHERLAEEMRRSEELRSRTANIDLIDELLAAVTDQGELRTVIDRVSEIAQKVLPHDAMLVPLLLADGAHVRFHTMRTTGSKFPEVMEIASHLRNSDWEFDIADDLQADPEQRHLAPAKLGYRSALRVPIRVEGQLTAGVGFFSFKPSFYKETDVPIARRVADRLAISLMREQGMQATKRADEAAERASRLESRVQALTDELNSRAGFHRVIGKSASWKQVLTQASQVAATETTVLLLGESGTGKEVVARFLHRASTRKNGPFVALNCAALPEQLLESELFGYERGAFTGAMVSRAGKIEQAAGGVLFLDEVGEMSPAVQAKFLRVLQEREFQRLGGAKTLKADARVIAATNRDPKISMERGTFREDLYYRLSVFEISLPPLRERRDDILVLVEAFLADMAKSVGRPAAGLSEDAKDKLLSYSWPGNVRELRNAIERAVILCEGGLISSEHLPIAVGQARSTPSVAASAPVASSANLAAESAVSRPRSLRLEDHERDLLEKAMLQAQNNKSQAAKLLGVPRGQFYSLLKRHGMTDAKR